MAVVTGAVSGREVARIVKAGATEVFEYPRDRGDLLRFVDNLGLSPEEERSQAGQFAGLGAAAMPLIAGASNLIQKGNIGGGVPMKRWLPAQILTGAAFGGALPAVRHALERKNLDQAQSRRSVAKDLLGQGAAKLINAARNE